MDSRSLTSIGAESLEALKQEFLRNELARNNETHGAYLRAIQHLFRGWMPERPPVVIPDSLPVIAPPSSQNSIWEQAPSNAPVHVYFSSDQDDGASGPARTL